jgi:hypothetical protein
MAPEFSTDLREAIRLANRVGLRFEGDIPLSPEEIAQRALLHHQCKPSNAVRDDDALCPTCQREWCFRDIFTDFTVIAKKMKCEHGHTLLANYVYQMTDAAGVRRYKRDNESVAGTLHKTMVAAL